VAAPLAPLRRRSGHRRCHGRVSGRRHDDLAQRAELIVDLS
jgi:hypothetical protein